jgi:hypothetical protein
VHGWHSGSVSESASANVRSGCLYVTHAAIALNEDSGRLEDRFGKWYEAKAFEYEPVTGRWRPANELAFYMREVGRVCAEASRGENINVRSFDSFIRKRVGIERALTGAGVPADLVPGLPCAMAGMQEVSFTMSEQNTPPRAEDVTVRG